MVKKEKSCLVAQNLVNAVDWFLTAPDVVIKDEKGGDGKITWKEKAHTDLCNTIRRVKTPFPEVAQRGVDFEKKVYETVNKGIFDKGSEIFQEVCKSVEGYEFYQKGGENRKIAGENCYLYCKYDAIKTVDEKVYVKDLKTTGKYARNKYLKTFQHKIYCDVSRADEFQYVIAEWLEYPHIKAIHYENFLVEDRSLLKKEVETTIENTFEVIQDLGLWDDYRNKFCLY